MKKKKYFVLRLEKWQDKDRGEGDVVPGSPPPPTNQDSGVWHIFSVTYWTWIVWLWAEVQVNGHSGSSGQCGWEAEAELYFTAFQKDWSSSLPLTAENREEWYFSDRCSQLQGYSCSRAANAPCHVPSFFPSLLLMFCGSGLIFPLRLQSERSEVILTFC